MRKLLILLQVITTVNQLPAQTKNLSFRSQLLCIDNNEVCVIGDINRDGLDDIVAGRNWYAAPDFVPRPVRSLGLQGGEYAKNNGEHLWDMNGDGWLDIVTSGYEQPEVLWFENPGEDFLNKGMEWQRHVVVETGIVRSEIGLFEDLNRDGMPEYILTSWHDPNPTLFWELHFSGDSLNNTTRYQAGPRSGHGVGVADINGDGRKDILFEEGWYQQPDDWNGRWTWRKHWKLREASCPILVTDVNSDGRQDIIYGIAHDYGLYWMEQMAPLADSTVWKQHLIDDSWSQAHSITWADLDGDGQGELITGKRVWAHLGNDPGAHEPAIICRYTWNRESQTFDKQVINAGEASTGLFIRVADLNRDQKPDIVVAGRKGTYILWQQ